MKKLAAALLLLPGLSSARDWKSYLPDAVTASGAACEENSPARVGQTQAYSGALGSGKCFVSIHPMNAGMVYRDYTVFGDGMLMVFSSYGEAEGPDMTSAREYYFFPRSGALHLALDQKAGSITVLMADGGRATFDPKNGQISGLDRGDVAVSPRVDRTERGGVEIVGYRGLMLDTGFRLGELPSGRPDASSTFRSAEGQTCSVVNTELFVYRGRQHALKYDDAGLSAFLKTRCPALHVEF